MENNNNLNPVVHSMGPVMRLVGHSASAVLGFAGIAILALIPIVVVKFVIYLGASELATPLHYLEIMMLFADVALFALVFLMGIVIFLVESMVYAKREIAIILKDD